jgi:uncharacterized protein (UPF0332 family)
MATFAEDLLEVADLLLERPKGKTGKLPQARIRRSISSAYYALFHFLLDEVGKKVVGTDGGLSQRRRILARTIAHRAAKTALEKIRGASIDSAVADFFNSRIAGAPWPAPPFARNFANAFIDAQAKRHEADYDLNQSPGQADARLMISRARRAIADWNAANGDIESDFKHSLCVLVILRGQLRYEP